MGMLRVLLALAVLLEHTGGIGGYAMIGGAPAVQAFFVISGFYMGLVLTERYDRPALNGVFWLNRSLRIYSLYFVFLALYLAVFAAVHLQTGSSPLWVYVEQTISTPEKLGLAVLNLTVIGQELPLFLKVAEGNLAWTLHPHDYANPFAYQFMAIPIAWSLSLELMFYAIAPFIVRRRWQTIAWVLAASLAARAVAAGIGLSGDPFSYRFFPFELALFLAGVLAYRAYAARPELWRTRAAKLLAVALPLYILAWPWILGETDKDLFFTAPRLGLIVLTALALPALHGWFGKSRRDRAFGELSYPLYLNHLLVLGVLRMNPQLRDNDLALTVAVVAVAFALAYIVVNNIDRPIEAVRRRIATRAGAGGQNRGDIAAAIA